MLTNETESVLKSQIERLKIDKIALIMCIIYCVIMWFVISFSKDYAWKKEAIKKGHAEYNQTTGIFQWKELKK